MPQPDNVQPDLFTQLGLQALPQDEKLKLLQKIELAAREQVINLILDQLSDADCEDLDKLLKKESTEEDVLSFLQDRIPRLEELIKDRIEQFKNELIGEVASIRAEIEKLEAELKQAPADADKQDTDKQQVKEKITQLDADLKQALKKGDFENLTDILQKSRTLKGKIQ